MRPRLLILLISLWIGTLAAAFWIGRYSVNVPPPPSEPTLPELVTVKDEWAGSEQLLRTVRNKGAAGEMLFVFRQGNRAWTFRTAFNAGEERQIRFDLTGIRSDQPSTTEYVPVAQASPSQLQGAIVPR